MVMHRNKNIGSDDSYLACLRYGEAHGDSRTAPVEERLNYWKRLLYWITDCGAD
jgi:hypothetical protein